MRNIYILCFCLLGFLPLSAQTFSGAIVAGFNMSQIDGDNLAGFRRIGLNTGARVAAQIHNKWQLSMELLYSQQGASRSNVDPLVNYGDIRLNLVEAPLMINYQDWKILASGGFSYGRLINYSVTDVAGADISDLEQYKDDIFSIILGATFFFSEKWGLNVRWSKSLNSFRENDPGQYFKNRNIGIRVYYLL